MNDSSDTHQTHEILEMFPLETYQTQTCFVEDFLVPLLALQENVQGSHWKTREELSLLKCLGSHGISEYHTFSLRTSKDYSTTITDEPSQSFSESWMRWGMTVNGNCLTAKTSESHNTENESSLWQILEDTPDLKYFLSEERVQKMIETANQKKERKSLSGVEETEPLDTTEQSHLLF